MRLRLLLIKLLQKPGPAPRWFYLVPLTVVSSYQFLLFLHMNILIYQYIDIYLLIKKLLLIIGCDAKHLFNLIEGSWGEQLDVETPPKEENEPVFKKFKASSPTPSSASASSTVSSATPKQSPTKYFILPWEVGALASIPAKQWPSYELRDSETKKYYCQICGNGTENHDSMLTHVCHIHLNIILGCHYCDFASPSYATLKKYVSDKHAGLPVQVAPPSEEPKSEMTIIMTTPPMSSYNIICHCTDYYSSILLQ